MSTSLVIQSGLLVLTAMIGLRVAYLIVHDIWRDR